VPQTLKQKPPIIYVVINPILKSIKELDRETKQARRAEGTREGFASWRLAPRVLIKTIPTQGGLLVPHPPSHHPL
jgi:hypothetical protein